MSPIETHNRGAEDTENSAVVKLSVLFFCLTMETSSGHCLKKFVNERLTAAAEEIFGMFEKTLLVYKEEILRHRRLLDGLTPDTKLRSTGEFSKLVC